MRAQSVQSTYYYAIQKKIKKNQLITTMQSMLNPNMREISGLGRIIPFYHGR
jgi:hypothetical protein